MSYAGNPNHSPYSNYYNDGKQNVNGTWIWKEKTDSSISYSYYGSVITQTPPNVNVSSESSMSRSNISWY